jgi:hypothetical protein
MLALLTEAETSIRRSASVRLVVETLLLRWTLMDRVVEIEQVLRTGGRDDGKTGSLPTPRSPAAPPVVPSSRPPVEASRPPVVPSSRPTELSLATLTAAWPEIVEAARARSILLGQALEATPPGFVGPGVIRLVAGPEHALLVEGVQRQMGMVEELVQGHFGVRARITVAAAQAMSTEPQERPKRITDEALRREKLERLRRIDPALDTAANELDLEIVDEA